MHALESNLSIVATKQLTFFSEHDISVDQVTYTPKHHQHLEIFKSYWKENNLEWEHLKGRPNGYQVENIQFLYHYHNPNFIYRITGNPNDFVNIYKWDETVKRVIPPQVYKYMMISKLDIAWDFYYWYHGFRQSILVDNKKRVERILDDSKEGTIYVGGKPEEYKMYDKVRELQNNRKKSRKLNKDNSRKLKILSHEYCTRLEVSLSDKKLPTKNNDELIEKLLSPKFRPFSNTFYVDFDYSYVPPKKLVTPAEINTLKNYIKLKTLIEEIGLIHTKKRLKIPKKPTGKYGKLLKINARICLGDFYKEAMGRYLQEGLK